MKTVNSCIIIVENYKKLECKFTSIWISVMLYLFLSQLFSFAVDLQHIVYTKQDKVVALTVNKGEQVKNIVKMISSILSRLVILLFGTLYPAYSSYKAVKTRNFKEYTKWMMYWIIFAFFTCAETLTDVFFSWFPFYYEIKIVLVLYLLSPVTKGSSILYRKFVHPALSFREQEIDDYISKAKEHSYKQVLDLTSKGVTTILQTAVSSITQIPSTLSSFSNRPLDSAYQESLYTSDSTDEFMQLEFSSSEEEYNVEKKVKKDMKEKRSLKKKRSDTNVETRRSTRKVKKTSLELND